MRSLDPSHGDMSIYAMVDFFKRLKISNLDISVKTTQEYAASVDDSCPWEWILTIGSRKSTYVHVFVSSIDRLIAATGSQVNIASSCQSIPVM